MLGALLLAPPDSAKAALVVGASQHREARGLGVAAIAGTQEDENSQWSAVAAAGRQLLASPL